MQQAELDSTQTNVVLTLADASDTADGLRAMAQALAALPDASEELRPLMAICVSAAESLYAALGSMLRNEDVADFVIPAHVRMGAVVALFVTIRELPAGSYDLRRTFARLCVDDLQDGGGIVDNIDAALACAGQPLL